MHHNFFVHAAAGLDVDIISLPDSDSGVYINNLRIGG
jgi:hypothetical protein